jgi:hypothetical protein
LTFRQSSVARFSRGFLRVAHPRNHGRCTVLATFLPHLLLSSDRLFQDKKAARCRAANATSHCWATTAYVVK